MIASNAHTQRSGRSARSDPRSNALAGPCIAPLNRHRPTGKAAAIRRQAMKLARALFLSSKKQAESWEYFPIGIFLRKRYRFLVDDCSHGGNLRLSIFCVHQEQEEQTTRMRDIVAASPHVEKDFED